MSIKQSDTKYPQGVNQRRDWPTHVNNWKQEIFDVFKNCTGEVTSTHTELSYCKGVVNRFAHRRLLSSTTSGASYVITPDPAYTSIPDACRFTIKSGGNNLDNPTITVNSLAAISLVYPDNSAIEADFIPNNSIFEIIYDETQGNFQLLKIGGVTNNAQGL